MKNLVHLVDGASDAWINLDEIQGVDRWVSTNEYNVWLHGEASISLTPSQYAQLLPHLNERLIAREQEA